MIAAFAVSTGGACFAQSDVGGGIHPLPVEVPSVPLNAPIPQITVDAGDESGLVSGQGNFTITGGVTIAGGSEFSLRADSVTGNMQTGIATAVGHVSFRELNSYLSVDSLFASQQLQAGSATNAEIYSAPYLITADRLVFQQNEVDLYDASLTTSPPDQKPEYSIRAKSITYMPLSHKILLHEAAFYLGKKRIIEERSITLHTSTTKNGQSATSNIIASSFGYTGYNGPFIVYRTHVGTPSKGIAASITLPERHSLGILVTATTPLISSHSNNDNNVPKTLIGRIRAAAEATEPILPQGDPLLFHWFQTVTAMNDRFLTIPNNLTLSATGTASYREIVQGHETDNLFYSRLPEASLTAIAPISGPRSLPTSRDPQQMRKALKQIALYTVITPTVGRYYEYPDEVSSNRSAAQFSIESRPILVGKNLLFKPAIGYLDSTYPEKHQSFQVLQYDVAIEKYFTDETGCGFEYLQSQEHGSSPFQFDTPYTSQELDTRLQIGMPRVILGAVLKYDIRGHNLYSQQVMIAPVMRGVIPNFTYDFKDSSFGVGLDIQGLTY